jgi:hypothetical protein
MSMFIRRFTTDPGIEVLLEIEAVNILDLEPPGSISGVGTGTALLVAEFEDGPFNEPTEVTSATDLANTFGGFGFVYNGDVANNPCARSRKADGAIVPEYWNGNGIIALNGKKFRRLILCRVDTSVGSVEFERLAWLGGASLFSYPLSSGQTLVFGNATSSWTATFTGTPATLTSAAGTYPTGFAGGEVMTINRDGTDYTVVFQASDQTQAQVIARINAALGYTAAVDAGGGVTTLSSLVQGTSGKIEIKAPTTASVLTATGFALASASGGGNVANIAAVVPNEIDAVVNAASVGEVRVRQLASGQLRMENVGQPLTGVLCVTGGTAFALGFAVGQNAAWQDVPNTIAITAIDAVVAAATGFVVSSAPESVLTSGAGTYPTGFVGGETMTVQVTGRPATKITFKSTDQTIAQVASRINTTLGYTAVVVQSATVLALAGPGTNGSKVAAGTPVHDSAAQQWVTMQTFVIAADNPGPYSVKVRPATDDGTAPAVPPLGITGLARYNDSVALAVINPIGLSAALSESAIDAAYLTALDATLNPASVAAQANLIWSARQSNAVRSALRQNAIDASAGGLYGRCCAIRPPLGTTTRSQALSGAAQPGVGAYRDQRVWYCYPGVQTFVPIIASKGLAGGEGFSADGIIDVGADGFLISVCSQLAPEENPGQLTSFAGGAIGLEKNNPDVQSMTIIDYTNFRGAGICAPRMDNGTMIFQSGVTSVDPQVQPNLRNIARRRFADFLQDSLARRLKAFGKKLNTRTRRALITGEIRAFVAWESCGTAYRRIQVGCSKRQHANHACAWYLSNHLECAHAIFA